ncbi:hypothetical protein CMV_008988 [Castanea mollissima]|uniref:Uncharacterized protein n=1 Tax=Castanea mollissima TaxID=60419 RepID=A0A8J4R6F5_9ROSI|nr:hypothetical protein CMV_008988 [Castanea mollissima]
MAKSSTAKLFFLSSLSSSFRLRYLTTTTTTTRTSLSLTCSRNITTRASKSNKKKQKAKVVVTAAAKNSVAVKEKRRTRSDKALDEHAIQSYVGDGDSGAAAAAPHIPVMLGEVVDVFSSKWIASRYDKRSSRRNVLGLRCTHRSNSFLRSRDLGRNRYGLTNSLGLGTLLN